MALRTSRRLVLSRGIIRTFTLENGNPFDCLQKPLWIGWFESINRQRMKSEAKGSGAKRRGERGWERKGEREWGRRGAREQDSLQVQTSCSFLFLLPFIS